METFLSQAESLGERPFLYFHQDGDWRCLSWAEARDRVLRVAAALAAEGVRPGDRVALISENRFEWVLADFGIQAAAAVSVPIFPSLLPVTVHAIVEDCGAVVGLAGTQELAHKILGAGALRRVVTFEPDLAWQSCPAAECPCRPADPGQRSTPAHRGQVALLRQWRRSPE